MGPAYPARFHVFAGPQTASRAFQYRPLTVSRTDTATVPTAALSAAVPVTITVSGSSTWFFTGEVIAVDGAVASPEGRAVANEKTWMRSFAASAT